MDSDHSQLLAILEEPFNAEPSSSTLVESAITTEDVVNSQNYHAMALFAYLTKMSYSPTIRGGNIREVY
jgi:hypothetical protein